MNAPVDALELPPTQPMNFADHMEEFRALYADQVSHVGGRALVS